MEKIKAEVEGSGNLNKAYIPILQGISPGELQSADEHLQGLRDAGFADHALPWTPSAIPGAVGG